MNHAITVCYRTLLNTNWRHICSHNGEHRLALLWRFFDFGVVSSLTYLLTFFLAIKLSVLLKRFAGKSISETTLFCVECDVKPWPVVTSNISSELKDDVSGERALTRVTGASDQTTLLKRRCIKADITLDWVSDWLSVAWRCRSATAFHNARHYL